MRLIDIPDKSKLELRFDYKDKKYYINMKVYHKINHIVLIQAMTQGEKPIDDRILNNAVVTYKTATGVFCFHDLKFKKVTYQGTFLYAADGQWEGEKTNRRESYRVDISETCSLRMITVGGNVLNVDGLLKDISLTGMGLILQYKTENIITIEITLDMLKSNKVTLSSEIVRITDLPKEKGYLYGCRFFSQKEALNRYILKRQMQKTKNNNRNEKV